MKLAPPIILVTPAIARLRILLDVLVAIHAIPLLRIVRQSDGVLIIGNTPIASNLRRALDTKVHSLRRADFESLGWVGASSVADLVAGVVDDV